VGGSLPQGVYLCGLSAGYCRCWWWLICSYFLFVVWCCIVFCCWFSFLCGWGCGGSFGPWRFGDAVVLVSGHFVAVGFGRCRQFGRSGYFRRSDFYLGRVLSRWNVIR